MAADSTPSEMDSEGVVLPAISLSLRRPLIISAGIGLIAIAIAAFLGHILMGLLVIVGLALGLLNVKLVQGTVTKVTADDHPSKRKIAVSSSSRLLVITALALVIAFLLRPDGIGVFVGLALFQVVFVLHTTLPVLKGLRQQS